jgi:hypothetical protein
MIARQAAHHCASLQITKPPSMHSVRKRLIYFSRSTTGRSENGHGAHVTLKLVCVAVLILVALVMIPSATSARCLKKGIAKSRGIPTAVLQRLHVGWYYNWTVTPNEGAPNDLEFVPMVWGPNNVGKISLPVPIILGFNEPVGAGWGQANMTADQAVALWPRVQSAANRVGSPAIASSNPANRAWLRMFISAIRRNNLKVDFIPIHWYGPPDPSKLLAFVDSVHEEFGLPVWVTEFAVRNDNINAYTAKQALAYMQAVLPALESRSYLERYAWFSGPGPHPERLAPSRLVEENGTLTPLGQYYASFSGSGAAACQR